MPNPEVSVIVSAKDALSPLLAQLENKTKASTDRMGGQWQKLAAVITSAFAGDRIIGFATRGLNEIHQMTLASNQLTASLHHHSEELEKLAGVYAKSSIYKKEEIISAESTLALYTKNEKQIKSLIPAVLNLASKTGMDLPSAAKAVGMSWETSRNVLQRYGITLHEGVGTAARVEEITRKMALAFGDQTKAAYDAMSPMQKWNKQLDSIAESMAIALLPAINRFSKWFADNQDKIEKFANMAGKALGFIIDHSLEIAVIALAGTAIPRLTTAIQTFGVKSLLALGPILTAITAIDMGVNLLIANMEKKAEKRGNWFGNPETVKQVALLQKEFKNLDNDASMAAEKRQKEIDKQLQSLTGFKAAELPDFRAALLLKPKIEPEETPDVSKLGTTPFGKAKKPVEIPFEMNDKAIMAQGLKVINATRSINKMKLDSSFFLLKTEIDINEKRISNEERFVEVYRKLSNQQVAQSLICASMILADIANISDAYGQDVIVRKRMMQGQALINTYFAATQAYAEGLKAGFPVGFVLAPAMMALAIASGIANVKRIEGIKFAFGGEIPGNPSKGDYVPALLTPGELVITKRQYERSTSTVNYHIDNSTVVQGGIDPRAVKDFNRSRQRQARDLINMMRYAKMTGANIGTFA